MTGDWYDVIMLVRWYWYKLDLIRSTCNQGKLIVPITCYTEKSNEQHFTISAALP